MYNTPIKIFQDKKGPLFMEENGRNIDFSHWLYNNDGYKKCLR